jgi:hypothetical protein
VGVRAVRSEVGEHRTRTGEENPPVLALLHTRAEILYNVSLNMCLPIRQFSSQFPATRDVVALRRCLLTLLTYFTVCLSSRLIKHVSSSSSCDARSNAYRLADAPASGIEAD